MKTIEWKCTYCSLHTTSRTGNKVKHLYIFPDKYEDFEIFFNCPNKEQIRSYPQFHTELKCNKCGQYQDHCENIGYAWMCQACHLEQFKLLKEDIRMTISPFKNKNPLVENSCIFWQCIKCSKVQVNPFNDEIMQNTNMECLNCC